MKFRSFLLSFFFLFGVSLCAFSQYYDQDALKFSQPAIGGTSRIQALGGAQTSLGGDMSNLFGNPAGLGFFRRSDFSITAGLNYNTSKSTYLSTDKSDNKFFFNVPNFGIVFSWAKDDIVGGKGRGGAFGISFNRTSSFQNQFSYIGVNPATPENPKNSFLDFLVSDTKDTDPKILHDDVSYAQNNIDYETTKRAAAAYNSFLINPNLVIMGIDTVNSNHYSRFNDGIDQDNPLVDIRQSGKVTTTGGSGSWNFSYGGNYNNKFYFGASLGVPRIRYTKSNTYLEEFDLSKNINNIDNYTYQEDKTVNGTGLSFKLGFMYKINDYVRLGLSGSTPSITWMKETSTSSFVPYFPSVNYSYYSYSTSNIQSVNLNDFASGIKTSTVPRDTKYTLVKPATLSGGISIFLGKHGFFTGDAEFIPYKSTMRVSGDGLDDINSTIQNTYKDIFNFRGGFEGRFDIFRARVGGAYLSDPYQTHDIDRSQILFTAGAGIRTAGFYFDIAGIYSTVKSAYSPYNFSPTAFIKTTPVSLNLTVGFRFN